jgi:hypothetical protein
MGIDFVFQSVREIVNGRKGLHPWKKQIQVHHKINKCIEDGFPLSIGGWSIQQFDRFDLTGATIMVAVHQCARFSLDPRLQDEQSTKRIVRYLKRTPDKRLFLRQLSPGGSNATWTLTLQVGSAEP